VDPDLDPDPAIFDINLQDDNKKLRKKKNLRILWIRNTEENSVEDPEIQMDPR
jgi:hypothetical protein